MLNKNSKNITTPVVDINLFESKSTSGRAAINEFVKITIPCTSHTKPNEIKGKVTVPFQKSDWTPRFLDYNMSVHRVDAHRNGNMRIEVSPEKKIKVIV